MSALTKSISQPKPRASELTEGDLWKLIHQGKNVTAYKGEVIEMSPAGRKHGRVANKIAYKLTSFIESKKLGAGYTAETGFVVERSPLHILAPDFAFITKERDEPQELGFGKIIPDFVLEVRNPSETLGETTEKILEWIAAGVKLVWLADMKTQSVAAYRKEKGQIRATIYTSDKSIDGGDVFKGFSAKVSEFFE